MIVIVMGVVGAGKTTVGKTIAQELGWEFADADDFHPASNVEKIRHGIGLTDQDRQPWLDRMRTSIIQWIAARRNIVLACSALKESYRQTLRVGPDVRFVYLKGDTELIAERLRSRHGHFAGEQILGSQLADLEEPVGALTVDISDTPRVIADKVRKGLGLE